MYVYVCIRMYIYSYIYVVATYMTTLWYFYYRALIEPAEENLKLLVFITRWHSSSTFMLLSYLLCISLLFLLL